MKPNIIYIYADDLGRGMLSCYGQKQFVTPNIDRICDQGMQFERAYGCAFCAPARASLITGIHDCHAGGWSFSRAGIYNELNVTKTLDEIYEQVNNSIFNDIPSQQYLPHILKKKGYYTGEIGKLEWGFATSKDDIQKHGWDYHFGYYDHQQCHGFYPPYLFEDGEVINIEGNLYADCGKNAAEESEENYKKRWDMTGKAVYSQDIFDEKIVKFIEQHKEEPFFLYHPSQLPHGPVSIPRVNEQVKDNKELSNIEKEYASMVLRLDDTVGLIFKTLERLNLLDNTMIIFSSDNGHEIYYEQEGRCSSHCNLRTGKKFDEITESYTSIAVNDIFNGNDSMKGKKRSNSEGGVRIPYLVSWKNHIKEGAKSSRLIANYDLMATFADLMEVDLPEGKDGISFLDELLGRKTEDEHKYVVYASHRGPGLTTNDGWKIRYLSDTKDFELYDLKTDYQEKNNLAKAQPMKLRELAKYLLKECDGNFDNGTPFRHGTHMIEEVVKA